MIKVLGTSLIVLAMCSAVAIGQQDEREMEYLIGGPLAGIKIPLFPTHFGEPPGHPGAIPGEHGTEDLAPQMLLYPGSVENYRAYMFKYMPIRSFFDRQSQIRNWVAPDIPGVNQADVEQYASPLYFMPRHADAIFTGRYLEAVPVVRMKIGTPVIDLELGELERGMYVVRVIGAVETEHLRTFRRPLYMKMIINDGIREEVGEYRMSIGYVDEFYSAAEFYFHAVEKRNYNARLFVDEGSEVELLVHNISLDDALAGTTRRAIKTRSRSAPPEGATQDCAMPRDQRWARDEALWRAMPPLNFQGGAAEALISNYNTTYIRDFVRRGAEGKLQAEINRQHGAWELVPLRGERGLFTNNLDVGRVFLRNQRLNLEYTIDDLIAGRPLPDPYPYKDDGAGLFYVNPERDDMGLVWSPIAEAIRQRVHEYAPTPDATINNAAQRWLEQGDADAGRDAAVALVRYAYQNPSLDMRHYLSSICRVPIITGRDLTARNRMTEAFFLPHYMHYTQPVSTYERLYSFIDGNHDFADSINRFVPWVRTPDDVIELLDVYLVQTIGKRIMRYHYHTNPNALQSIINSLGDREVTAPMEHWLRERAWFYPLEPIGLLNISINGFGREGASNIGSTFYARRPQSDETPKFAAYAQFNRRATVAGIESLRIGDVTGPDKAPGGRMIMDNRSRVVEGWASILETGHQHNDHRLRAAAYLRTGMGVGHSHNDTLDLQIFAHGLPMTIDGGQRPGYGQPPDAFSLLHNLVLVDGQQHHAHSWGLTLADMPRAQYVRVAAAPPRGASLMERQLALVDVDDDQTGGTIGLDRFANSYVVDVVRVTGGEEHTYAFHAMINDQFESNIVNEKPDPENPFISRFPQDDTKFAGVAPENLAATWRYRRGGMTGSEQSMLGNRFIVESPPKYSRLHLLDVVDSDTMRADAICTERNYRYTVLFVQRKAEQGEMDGAFLGLIEPYAGEPFIESVESLEIAENEDDALKAVAARIITRPGHVDIVFADGRPEKTRQVEDMRLSGEFAYYSTDEDGLRQASMVGGELLEVPGLRIVADQRERIGRIIDLDYERKTVTIDSAWPAESGDRLLDIQSGGRQLSFTTVRVQPDGDASLITMMHSADYYRSPIERIDEEERIVYATGKLGLGLQRGLEKGWVATNDHGDRVWRADAIAANRFQLDGDVTIADFAPQTVMRLWEYGVGDEVSRRTFVSIRRLGNGAYEVSGDVDVEISFDGRTYRVSAEEFINGGGKVYLPNG